MEMVTSREAADRLGITVRAWFWLVEKHQLKPAKELPGKRGAKLWLMADVDRLRAEAAA